MVDESTKPGALEEIRQQPIFHLAFSVTDLEAARLFYVDTLGCRVGRYTEDWIDFNFFGYQITAHLVNAEDKPAPEPVGSHDIPVPHFGLIINWEDWHRAVDHLNYIGVGFHISPQIRFKGQPGEQASFFLQDPAGNCLELKAFKEPGDVFRTN